MKRENNYLDKVIIGMLTENTGRHFLDSGGAYGRHWERNQLRDFQVEKAVGVEIDGNDDGTWDYANVVYNIFHFMKNHLYLDHETGKLNRAFNAYANKPENAEKHWLELMEEWIEENFGETQGFNTYNGESLLSQVLQGSIVETEEGTFVILQVHGGCDVRGGYTRPHIFGIADPDYFWLAQVDVYASCNGLKFDPNQLCFPGIDLDPHCRNHWTSDDAGYNYYFEGCSSDEKPIKDHTRYDPETGKLHCLECGGEIIFSVMESF